MITRAMLENPGFGYRIFSNVGKLQEVEKPREGTHWALFTSDDWPDYPDLDQELEAAGFQLRSVKMGLQSPQRDDDRCQNTDVDDSDAWLAYLGKGGAIVYVPDMPGSKYGRYFAVRMKPGLRRRLSKSLPGSAAYVDALAKGWRKAGLYQ